MNPTNFLKNTDRKNLVGGVMLAILVTGVLMLGLYSRRIWPFSVTRGGDFDRTEVVNELRNMYNYAGERTVLVEADGKTIRMTFLDEPMKRLRRHFFVRHRDDFQRYYDAGFDKMIVEAKKDGGESGYINYDLTYYNYR